MADHVADGTDGEGRRRPSDKHPRMRKLNSTRVQKERSESDANMSDISEEFLNYQKEIDARNDKAERILKIGRDVTIESKRIIFLLHRSSKQEEVNSILEEANERITGVIKRQLLAIAKELHNEDPYSFSRSYSPGIQEFVEALTYYYYLKEERLISYDEVKTLVSSLIFETGEYNATQVVENNDVRPNDAALHISFSDYILGVADMTGELMRKCINSIGSGNVDQPMKLCHFMRFVHRGFLTVGNLGPREISRKTHVLNQSLQKVESACYTLQVRGSEVPKHMLVDVVAASLAGVADDYDDPNFD